MKLKKILLTALVALVGGGSSWAAESITSGTSYYIQNVESGLFLAGANNWGTRSSATTQGDLFTANKALLTGKYALVDNDLSSSNKSLGTDLYTDKSGNNWTITAVTGETGVFTISDGTNYLAQSATAGNHTGFLTELVASVTPAAKWYFLTEAEAKEKLAKTTLGSSMSASFLLGNANFSRNHTIATLTKSAGPWTIASGCTNANLCGGQLEDKDGKTSNGCAESFHSPFTISQKLTGIPNGVYGVTAQGFVRVDGGTNTAVFFANESTTPFPLKTGNEDSMTDASNSFATGNYTINEFRVQVTDGTLEVGVKNETNSELWCIWDNFNLTYYGDIANIENGTEITAAYVTNYDFIGCENNKFPGWAITNPNGGNANILGDTNVEYWIGTASNGKFDYSQTVTGLPMGKYKVVGRMWNSMNGVAGTFAPTSGVYAKNGATTVWGLVDSDCDNGSMVEKESDEIIVTNGTLQIGVANKETMVARWFGVDWIKLIFVESVKLEDYRNNIAGLLAQANAITGKQTASLVTALEAAVNAAAGYETNEDIAALQNMIDGLNAAIENSNASIAAYAALNSVLNDIYVDRSAAFGTEFTYRTEAQAMYDEATAATADVQAKANGMLNAYRDYVRDIAEKKYPAKVNSVKAARENGSWEYTTNPQNNAVLNNAVNKDVAANSLWENWRGTGLSAGDMKQTVKGLPNGKYFLRMSSFTRNSQNENDYIYVKSGDAEAKSVSLGDASTTNAFINITNPIEVTNGQVEIGLHVGSGADWAAIGGVELHVYSVDDYARETATQKYGTICLPYAATVEGATVYSASINDAGTSVVLEEVVTNLVAGTPYIYQATANAQTFAYASGNIVAAPVAAAPLVGVFTATPAPVGSYVMQTLNGKQQFYIVGSSQPTVGAFKAYISAPASGKASFSIGFADDDNATAVDAINALVEGKAEIYTVGGVKLQKLQKGLNIVNGVPVMVK